MRFFAAILGFGTVTCLLLTEGCSSDDHLIDGYSVYDDPIVLDGRHALMCQLGCAGDPMISNIVEIQWNDKAILVTNSNGQHYMILAKGERLQGCSGDPIIGPWDEAEFQKRMEHTDIGGHLNSKKYE